MTNDEARAKRAATIMAELAQFCGSDTLYRHPLWGRLYTEGVARMSNLCDAHWLLDSIFAKQYQEAVAREDFQVWKLTTHGSTGVLTCEDGNDNEVYREDITYTDFPLPELTLWFENDTLMLPGVR